MAPLAKRPLFRPALAGLVVLLIACAALSAQALRFTPDELPAARLRWNAQAFSRYRLVVNEETSADSCRQEVQVEHEKITAVLLNQCVRIPSWTVSTLFAWAAGLDSYTSRCYPSAVTCVCHAIYTSNMRFDPQLGYPQQITYQWSLSTNWAYAGHWERLWRAHELPDCGAVARRINDHTTVTVVSLTELP